VIRGVGVFDGFEVDGAFDGFEVVGDCVGRGKRSGQLESAENTGLPTTLQIA